MKKRALVIAPGRGTYNKTELGYLKKYHTNKTHFLSMVDKRRKSHNQTLISELDGRATYSLGEHSRGDNASTLIYACAYCDFLSIDLERYDLVAVTGNSMGWYIALGCTSALSEANTTNLINTMGTMMQDSLIGGQLIYPIVNENWQIIEDKKSELEKIVIDINKVDENALHISIDLGGYIVFGGNGTAIQELQKRLPPCKDRFPLILPNHAAFHTPLLKSISNLALETFSSGIFNTPHIPMIDGRGHIWTPYTTNKKDIYEYTFGHQVTNTYNFTRSVQVGMMEFAPDCIIVLGPGSTLCGAIAQILIQIEWEGLNSKGRFIERQHSDNPILYAMGIEEQRANVIQNIEC